MRGSFVTFSQLRQQPAASGQQQTVTTLGMRFCSPDQSFGPPRVSSHLVGIYPPAIPCLPRFLFLLGSPLVPKGVWSPRRPRPLDELGKLRRSDQGSSDPAQPPSSPHLQQAAIHSGYDG